MGHSRTLENLLDPGLDELAVSAHAGFWPRVMVNAVVAAVFMLVLPWPTCAAWGGVTLALEGQAWFSTRRQYLGRPVGWRIRLWHAGGLAASSAAWVAIGALLWQSGSLEGALCAVVVWMAVIFFAQTNAYQSPLGFVLGGAFPMASVLAIVALGPHAPRLHTLPVIAMLALGFGFAGEGVARMLKARSALADAQEQLRRSEALYRVLADNVTDVISLADVNGRRIYFSPSAERALGYPLTALYEMPMYQFIHPDNRAELSRKVQALAEHGGETTAQYRVVNAKGESVWVETNFTLAPGADANDPPQVISVARNIQARKELEAQLIEAREAAEAAAAAKSDFLANMTHELRTPLNAIIGFSSLLKDSSELGFRDARHARLISDASNTLLDLVNSVLDFSRLEAGAVELDPEPFDPAAEALGIVELMADQAAAKGLELTLSAGPAALVGGDAKRLRQVLLNLVSNAIKFTASGRVTLKLASEPAADGCVRLRFEVADTGVGLPESQIASLFERFTQADVSVSRRYGGTGLGLAICKRIVELMGGRIGAESREGEGSTFWFEVTLPAAESLTPNLAPEAPTLEGPARLLLVEDVAINRELVRTVLAAFDVEIEMAENGVDAIEAFRHGAFDLVLMDVQMPIMDGLTATRRIRALPTPAAATTPIIAMTANVLPDQVARCLDAGMDGHLGKPMNPRELVAVISAWAGRARTPSQPAPAHSA